MQDMAAAQAQPASLPLLFLEKWVWQSIYLRRLPLQSLTLGRPAGCCRRTLVSFVVGQLVYVMTVEQLLVDIYISIHLYDGCDAHIPSLIVEYYYRYQECAFRLLGVAC